MRTAINVDKSSLAENECIRNLIYAVLIRPCAPMPSPVRMAQKRRLLKVERRLMLHNPELADAVIYMDHRIPQGIRRKKPLILIPAVALVNDPHMVCLYDPEIFKRTAPGDHMGLIPGRKLHGHAQGNQGKFTLFKRNLLRRPQIDPVRFAANIGKLFYVLREIFDSDLHVSFSCPLSFLLIFTVINAML